MLGTYSPTGSTKGLPLQNTVYSGVADIVLGRRPLSDLDGLLQEWRAGGGDQIRGEFEKALADLKT